MGIASALLYARTLRHLRPTQVAARLVRRMRRPSLDNAPAPPRRALGLLPAPAAREPVLIGPTRIQMLGSEGALAHPGDWDDPERSALWRYHSHYFDDLRATGSGARIAWNRDLIRRWMAEVQPEHGCGWDAYPTSLRIVNWVRGALSALGTSESMVHSMAQQARWLRQSLEHHLLGNHLLANAKALVFAGVFFEGPEADEWRTEGLRLLARELREQVLSDGGHFERSPMYHSVILEDVLDLIALSQCAPDVLPDTRAWISLADRMRRWLRVMVHPDGQIALFNDAAFDQAPSPGALEEYARRLGLGPIAEPNAAVVHLEASGFLRAVSGDLVLFCDVGEIGPDYLPGHAHADTLSFELSHGRDRWFVDTGTSHYEPGAERLRQRTTAAHNTVEVDGESSSEVWSSFRVARRARPFDLSIEDHADRLRVVCSHDGYRRLPGRVVHTRAWELSARRLRIEDTLRGRFHTAVSRVYLHPDLEVREGRIELPNSVSAQAAVTGANLAHGSATWHPRFGANIPTSVLSAVWERPQVSFQFDW